MPIVFLAEKTLADWSFSVHWVCLHMWLKMRYYTLGLPLFVTGYNGNKVTGKLHIAGTPETLQRHQGHQTHCTV